MSVCAVLNRSGIKLVARLAVVSSRRNIFSSHSTRERERSGVVGIFELGWGHTIELEIAITRTVKYRRARPHGHN